MPGDEVERTISPWLVLAVLIITMIGFVGATLFTQRMASVVNDDAISIATNAAPAIQDLSEARSELVRMAIAVDQSDVAAFAKELPDLRDDLSHYLQQPFYPREDVRYAEVDRTVRVLEARASSFKAVLANDGQRSAVDSAKAAVLAAAGDVDGAISQAVMFNIQEQRKLGLEIPRRRRHAHQVGWVLQALTAICGLILTIFVIRGIRAYARLLARARAASQARDDLLAMVSYDLWNPINVINLMVRSMRRASPDGGIEKQAARIERATERMARLIDDLLEAAKIEAGALRTDRKPEDPSNLIEAVVEMFRPSADEKSIRVASFSPATASAVSCERHLILRVLSNILGNAVKFSPQGGAITVKAECLADAVRFSVSDSGPGIPAEHRRDVFDRYWHQKQGNRPGTGLGLYIAKGIVEAHGGRIWIEDAGPGTTVSFTLPLERAAG